MAPGPITSWQIDKEPVEIVTVFVLFCFVFVFVLFLASKALQMVTAAMK